jgi:hypothetical protein
LVVFLEYFSLEQPETLDRIVAPAEIHAGFIEFQLDPSREQPID